MSYSSCDFQGHMASPMGFRAAGGFNPAGGGVNDITSGLSAMNMNSNHHPAGSAGPLNQNPVSSLYL